MNTRGAFPALFASAAVAASSAVAQVAPSSSDLSSRLTSAWPRRGAVHVVFGNDLNTFYAGYEFSSGAWYCDLRDTVDGMDETGQAYAWKADNATLDRITKPFSGFSSVLDGVFPGVMLREMLAAPGALRSSAAEGAGLALTFQFPRGRRSIALAELPAPELARWGGPEKIMRTVRIGVDANLNVRSIKIGDAAESPIDTSPSSPPGFQVASHGPAPNDDMMVKECRFDADATPANFSIAEVCKAATGRRIALHHRTPVTIPAGADPPAPIRTVGQSLSFDGTSLVIAGLATIGVGGLAWVIKKRFNTTKG